MFSRIRNALDHKAVASNLSAYLDGALSAPERERVERHLAVCARCRYDLATLRQTVELLRRVPPKRVPRSFVLPASAQAERIAYRRWGLVNAFLRASAVAVTFMLVLLLSTEALFRFGAIPISGPPPAPQYTAPQARAVEAVPEVSGTREVEVESKEVVAQAPPSPEPTVAPMEAPAEEPPAEQPTASPEVRPPEAGKGGETVAEKGVGGEPLAAPERETVVETEVAVKRALPAPAEAPAEGTFSAETKVAAMSKSRPAEEGAPLAEASPSVGATATESATGAVSAAPSQDMGSSPAPTSTWTPAPTETPTATPTATETPTPTATPKPTATPTATETATPTATPEPSATPLPTEPAPSLTAEPAEPGEAFAASPLWRLWATVRLLSGLLAGLLCILFAGLLWTSRKRRI